MTNRMIKETAKAWGLTFKEVRKLDQWIECNIPNHRQSLIFANLLRRKYKA